jgi:hypothetical protein
MGNILNMRKTKSAVPCALDLLSSPGQQVHAGAAQWAAW